MLVLEIQVFIMVSSVKLFHVLIDGVELGTVFESL